LRRVCAGWRIIDAARTVHYCVVRRYGRGHQLATDL
jgi:hypothetical protein